jgi:hypothetical protein
VEQGRGRWLGILITIQLGLTCRFSISTICCRHPPLKLSIIPTRPSRSFHHLHLCLPVAAHCPLFNHPLSPLITAPFPDHSFSSHVYVHSPAQMKETDPGAGWSESPCAPRHNSPSRSGSRIKPSLSLSATSAGHPPALLTVPPWILCWPTPPPPGPPLQLQMCCGGIHSSHQQPFPSASSASHHLVKSHPFLSLSHAPWPTLPTPSHHLHHSPPVPETEDQIHRRSWFPLSLSTHGDLW